MDIDVLSRVEFNAKSRPVFNVSHDILRATVHKGSHVLPLTLRPKPKVGAKYAEMVFSTEMAGSGTAGMAPADSLLYIAGGMKHTNSPSTSDTYEVTGLLADIVTNAMAGAQDVDLYEGNAFKQACNESIPDISWLFRAGEPVEQVFRLAGTYEAQSEAAGSAAEATAAEPPVCVGLTATVGSQAVVLKSAGIHLNNTTNSPNMNMAAANGVGPPRLTNQSPTFEASFERIAIGTLDPTALFMAGTKVALQIIVGGTGGNICTIDVDGFITAIPGYGHLDGVGQTSIVCDMSWEAADQQLQLVFT